VDAGRPNVASKRLSPVISLLFATLARRSISVVFKELPLHKNCVISGAPGERTGGPSELKKAAKDVPIR
jgi:hypothetical protein